jgi:hypothetical protein
MLAGVDGGLPVSVVRKSLRFICGAWGPMEMFYGAFDGGGYVRGVMAPIRCMSFCSELS